MDLLQVSFQVPRIYSNSSALMFQHMASSSVGETEPSTELASYSLGETALYTKYLANLALR